MRGLWEKFGFWVMICLCVAVIVGSALWTRARAPAAESGPEDSAPPTPSIAQWATEPPFAAAQANAAQSSFVRPAQGDVLCGVALVFSQTLGVWHWHEGIDYGAEPGEAIRAMLGGTVTACYWDGQWGQTVELAHADGLTSRYCGLDPRGVATVGETLAAGQAVGVLAAYSPPAECGAGAHVHVELRRDGMIVSAP